VPIFFALLDDSCCDAARVAALAARGFTFGAAAAAATLRELREAAAAAAGLGAAAPTLEISGGGRLPWYHRTFSSSYAYDLSQLASNSGNVTATFLLDASMLTTRAV